jgi:DNA-binding NarL/FixJ family response regulator
MSESTTDQRDHRIRVLIANDSAAVRTGLRFFLLAFEDLVLVGEVDSVERAIRLCAAVEPDIILTDQAMPGIEALIGAPVVGCSSHNVQVIALARPAGLTALGAGWCSEMVHIVPRELSADELHGIIHRVYGGSSPMTARPGRLQEVCTSNAPVDFG